ncbi:M48 family metalloprotease [Sphingomonas sp. ac-8]|uniref:M48 family metalloprotease n=1 Tax=Sphingomonas sp. ac-8 TaxID=3242977 RepID=UPI003A80681E
MDVADRIEPAALGHLRRARGILRSPREEFRNHRESGTPPAMNMECRQMVHRHRVASAGRKRRPFARLHRSRSLRTILAALALVTAAAPASADEATFEAIRKVDTALGRIGYRLASANAPLCDRLEPGLGLLLHTPTQYSKALREEAIRYFRFDGPVGVEAVIPDAPAARAGIQANDTLLAIGPQRFASVDSAAEANTAAAIKVAAQVAALPPAQTVELRGRRDGADFVRSVTPVPACRTRFEVAIGSQFTAKADGEMVQIGSRFFEEYPEELVAAAVAHELSHNILNHRRRLEAQGVEYGMMSGFGRNVRYFRQTELEADILSVSLLANAGYDPNVAVRFWRRFGPSYAGGILRSRSHPAWQDRLATIEKAIADLGTARPARPAILDERNRPLDGSWQRLLVKRR